MRSILITGGAGFVASSLADTLLEREDVKLVLVDNLATGKLSNLPKNHTDRWKFIKADVNVYEEISAIMLSNAFDYVFHYAAVVGVDRTQQFPLKVLEDIEGFKHVLSLCKATGVKRIFFASSSEVYGEPVEIPQQEERTALNARLPYAIVKSVGESMIESYYKEHGLEYTNWRFFNTYGPKQSDDFVMSRFIKLALMNEPITIIGDGTQTRTFCWMQDNCDTVAKALDQGLAINDTVNIGNYDEVTILELARLVIEMTGSNSEIVFLPARVAGDMKRRQPDNTKMLQILGRELTPLRDGMRMTIEGIRERMG